MLTTQEAATFLGISVRYLYQLRCDGKLPCYKPFGKRCYFSENDLTELIKSKPDARNSKDSSKTNKL